MARMGEPIRPQVLFAGFKEDDPALLAMRKMVPSSRLMPGDGYRSLRVADWDALVTTESVDAPGHMFVLAFGSEWYGQAAVRGGSSAVHLGGKQHGRQLDWPDLDDPLRRLVVADLTPRVQSMDVFPFLRVHASGSWPPLKDGGLQRHLPDDAAAPEVRRLPPLVEPWLLDADENVIAGSFKRDGSGWCWALPVRPDHPESWLALALEEWHDRAPHRFPEKSPWRARSKWRTPKERSVTAELDRLRDERDRLVSEMARAEAELEAQLNVATAQGDAGWRRLLTAQGSELVAVVADALAALGFDVEDVDRATRADGSPKLEDLRLADSADPKWSNLTEVRGYAGGAKTSDFARLNRFVRVRLQQGGSAPTSSWYVVNHSLAADPDVRRPPLAGAQDDVDVFAEDGGLVIDTRALFHLLALVSENTAAADHVRAALRSATGIFPLEWAPDLEANKGADNVATT